MKLQKESDFHLLTNYCYIKYMCGDQIFLDLTYLWGGGQICLSLAKEKFNYFKGKCNILPQCLCVCVCVCVCPYRSGIKRSSHVILQNPPKP